MTEITLINSGFKYNSGDAGILLGTIEALGNYFGTDTRFNIESAWSGYSNKSMYEYMKREIYDYPPLWSTQTTPFIKIGDLGIIPNIPCLLETLIKVPSMIELNMAGKICYTQPIIRKDNRNLIDRMEKSDLIISCAGGSFHDQEGGSAFLKLLFTLKLALKLNKQVMIYAQSLGPFENIFYRKIFRDSMKKITFITVRDSYSMKCIKHLGINTPTRLTSDAAFSLPNPNEINLGPGLTKYIDDINLINEDKYKIGITVKNWTPNKMNRYIQSISKLISYASKRYNAQIIFFPHVSSDICLCREILSKVDTSTKNIHIVEENLHPLVLKALYGRMDAFVGTRMHSAIYSMSMNVPTISLSYMPKSKDLMKRIGFNEFDINIRDIDFDSLKQLFDKISNDRDHIKNKLDEAINQLKQLSLKNAEYAYRVSKGDII